jgi:hypothetical protein
MSHSFRGFHWSAIVGFAFIAYLSILFDIIVDLFWRDHQTPRCVKAVSGELLNEGTITQPSSRASKAKALS